MSKDLLFRNVQFSDKCRSIRVEKSYNFKRKKLKTFCAGENQGNLRTEGSQALQIESEVSCSLQSKNETPA